MDDEEKNESMMDLLNPRRGITCHDVSDLGIDFDTMLGIKSAKKKNAKKERQKKGIEIK